MKLSVSLDADNIEQLEATAVFVETLYQLAVSSNAAKPEPKVTAKVTEPVVKAKQSAKATVDPGNPEPDPVEPEEESAPEPEDSVTIEDVRAALALKVQNHREDIKTALTKLGANNVSTLDPSRFKMFIDYLNRLK